MCQSLCVINIHRQNEVGPKAHMEEAFRVWSFVRYTYRNFIILYEPHFGDEIDFPLYF